MKWVNFRNHQLVPMIALKRFDQDMSLNVEYYRSNLLDPFGYPKSKKQKQKEEAFVNLKAAFLKEDLSLKGYLYAVASQIEPTEYLNERVCGEALGWLGECGGVDFWMMITLLHKVIKVMLRQVLTVI